MAVMSRALCLLALAGLACAGPKVEVPPRVQLANYGTVGMVAFSPQGDHASAVEMADVATERFLAAIQGAQPGVPIVELGDSLGVLAAVDGEELDLDTIMAIGDRYGVDVVLIGELRADQAKPTFSMHSIESVRAGAKLEGVLSARLYQTKNGATLWTNAARGYQNIATVSLAKGRLPGVHGRDVQTVEQDLVRSLVGTLTRDFRPRWVRE
jgi:hypothetical protein